MGRNTPERYDGELYCNGRHFAALMPGQEDCVRQPAEGAMRGFGTLFVGCGSVQSGGSKEAPLTADLVVVNFEPQDYDGMEQFFLRHMYLEKRMVYLYANCIGTPEPDVLNRVYRVDEGQIGIVRYNAAYDCALKRGLGSSFIAEEYGSARSGRNQEFIDGLVKAADRILREVCKIDKTGHVW